MLKQKYTFELLILKILSNWLLIYFREFTNFREIGKLFFFKKIQTFTNFCHEKNGHHFVFLNELVLYIIFIIFLGAADIILEPKNRDTKVYSQTIFEIGVEGITYY